MFCEDMLPDMLPLDVEPVAEPPAAEPAVDPPAVDGIGKVEGEEQPAAAHRRRTP